MMFWITTNDGGLVNLAIAEQMRVCPFDNEYQLRAYFSTGEIVLLIGTREECGRKRDDIYRQLKEAQQRWGETDFC